MALYLDYINHTDGQSQVDCGVLLEGLRGVRQCTSPTVLAAAEALKAACRAELTGSIGSELKMTVVAKPVPVPTIKELLEPAP